tara:strand:- start:334 stop:999 length:666 start_codon:yes stop_codon:yes gene_type:complete
MPTIKVPEIKIPKVNIPETPFIPETVLVGENPACDLINRDLEISKNPTIIFHGRKAYATCPNGQAIGGTQPIKTQPAPKTFRPIVYDAQDTIETEGTYNFQNKSSAINLNLKGKEEDKEPELPPCPDLSRVLPVGSFTSDLRTSRIKEYIRADNGYDCVPILEEVTFLKSVLPTPAAALNVVSISLLAASSPLLISVIKAASKTFFKKVIGRFQKKKKDVK